MGRAMQEPWRRWQREQYILAGARGVATSTPGLKPASKTQVRSRDAVEHDQVAFDPCEAGGCCTAWPTQLACMSLHPRGPTMCAFKCCRGPPWYEYPLSAGELIHEVFAQSTHCAGEPHKQRECGSPGRSVRRAVDQSDAGQCPRSRKLVGPDRCCVRADSRAHLRRRESALPADARGGGVRRGIGAREERHARDCSAG